jgi:hypothetical protein
MNQPHPFDAAIRLEPQGEGHWRGATHEAYGNMVGPFGGATAAAVLAYPARQGEPLALTVNFAGPVATRSSGRRHPVPAACLRARPAAMTRAFTPCSHTRSCSGQGSIPVARLVRSVSHHGHVRYPGLPRRGIGLAFPATKAALRDAASRLQRGHRLDDADVTAAHGRHPSRPDVKSQPKASEDKNPSRIHELGFRSRLSGAF